MTTELEKNMRILVKDHEVWKERKEELRKFWDFYGPEGVVAKSSYADELRGRETTSIPSKLMHDMLVMVFCEYTCYAPDFYWPDSEPKTHFFEAEGATGSEGFPALHHATGCDGAKFFRMHFTPQAYLHDIPISTVWGFLGY